MYQIYKYKDNYQQEWDDFVMNKSINGTFLQTRRFLSYHPEDRFTDTSYIIYDEKGNIVAICPACVKYEEGKQIFFSHSGSTYGGIVFSKRILKTNKLITLFKELEDKWKEEKYDKIILKQTPLLFSNIQDEVIEYVLYYLNYKRYTELNMYIDLKEYSDNILSEFAQGKRTQINKCIRDGWYYEKITRKCDIERLHDLLSITLEKYDKKPIHTVDELYDFQCNRLSEECECFGAFFEGKMVGASLMFYFRKANVAHTQYLCADPEYNAWSPMSYMYYAMIKEAKSKNFNKLSWGIVTEDMGKYLNEGLASSKERFGSRHSLNYTYEKEFRYY